MQFAAMLTCLSNLIQYYVYLCQHRRKGLFLSRQGPMLLILLSSLLFMVHPTIFLLKDLQLIQPLCEHKIAQGALYACTDLGLFGLLYGALWGTNGFAVLWTRMQRTECLP